jgi:hypothetical protein
MTDEERAEAILRQGSMRATPPPEPLPIPEEVVLDDFDSPADEESEIV